jgi:hypothetical protein
MQDAIQAMISICDIWFKISNAASLICFFIGAANPIVWESGIKNYHNRWGVL